MKSDTVVTTKGLGTFAGVVTPSVLTILGLVLFLRLGYVVGNVGLTNTLLMLVLATSVSVLTSLSLATAASNLKIRGGGIYFLISRTLGIEFGGAVGLVLYAAMSVSVAFYSIGFAEAAMAALGSDDQLAIRALAAACVVVLMLFALLGSDWATRLQYLVMGLLVVALLSFFIGALPQVSTSTFQDGLGQPSGGTDFWTAFAVFFPAVTGFSQGVAMSGDLRSPSRSIVVGTFTAVGVSTGVYLAALLVLTGAAPLTTLRDETTTIMGTLSIEPWTAEAGVIAATISSAMASLLGAPRVLQRIAEDRIVPPLRSFAVGSGPLNNPRRATLLSAAVALGTVAAGDVNTVAPVITMFFLASYGLINYATYYEARAASTSFRPRFHWYHPMVSLAGALVCAIVVIAINPVAGAVAAFVLWGIHSYLQRQEIPERWSDSVHAHHYGESRRHLLALRGKRGSRRDWRPCMLVFVPHDHASRERMLHIATWLEGGAGFTTAVRVIEGSGPIHRRQAENIALSLENELIEARLPVLSRTVLATDLRSGVQATIQSHGIGAVKANTVVFGWYDLDNSNERDRHRYGEILQEAARFSTNVVIIQSSDAQWEHLRLTPPAERTIVVWWSNDQAGQLMTLMAWLCTRSSEWREATIEVVVPEGPDSTPVDDVRLLLDEARIDARVVPVAATIEAMDAFTESAALAFMPLRVRRKEPLGPLDVPIEQLRGEPSVTVFVLAIDDLDINVEPDESQLARHAQAVDEVLEARQKAEELDNEAARLLVEAELLRLDLDNTDPGRDGGRHRELAVAVDQAEVAAARAYRRYAEWRTRTEERQSRADALDPTIEAPLIDPAAWERSPLNASGNGSTTRSGNGSGNGNGNGNGSRSSNGGSRPHPDPPARR
jgi:amino acid transporter